MQKLNALIYSYTIEQLKSGSPAAFARLYREYKDKVYSFLLIKSNGNVHVAEDVLCDTFHSALKTSHKLKNTENIYGWLLQIASRRLADHFKKIYREKKLFGDFPEDIEAQNPIEDTVFLQQKIALLRQAFDCLNDKHKTVIRLRYIENKSLEEICTRINKNQAAVYNTLARARKALRKKFLETARGSLI